MWGEAARNTYNQSNIPEYVKNILGPMRKYYISEKRAAKELLAANVQVMLVDKCCVFTR